MTTTRLPHNWQTLSTTILRRFELDAERAGDDKTVDMIIEELDARNHQVAYCTSCGFPLTDCECHWHAAQAFQVKMSKSPDQVIDTERCAVCGGRNPGDVSHTRC